MTLPEPIYLQHSDLVTVPSFSNRPRPPPTTTTTNTTTTTTTAAPQDGYQPIRPSPVQKQHHRELSVSSVCSSNKRSKLNRDLLTDDEKRINHIASEQKRRNTIRTGFKDLTDMIPTLKNINNSKSTILFKAVEFIKHLDKRNRGLHEKIASLQVRMSVEGRMNQQRYRSSNSQRYKQIFGKQIFGKRQQEQQQTPDEFSHLPQHTVTALIAHKNQQRQLQELQEQLRQQQQLLAKHNITPPDINLPKRHTKKASKEHHYNSISIPSSTSSNSDETELESYSHMQHLPKKRPWHLL